RSVGWHRPFTCPLGAKPRKRNHRAHGALRSINGVAEPRAIRGAPAPCALRGTVVRPPARCTYCRSQPVAGHQRCVRFSSRDQMLKEVAARISAILRPGAVFARMRGDEFAVLCRVEDANDAESVALQILDGMNAPFS